MSTFPDQIRQFGGAPVNGRFEGMWGGKTYFVDYDNGTEGSQGLKAKNAQKYLDTTLGVAGAWDTIYVRGRTTADETGGDAYYILPSSTSNFTTSTTQYGLSIIGTQIGRGIAGSYVSTQVRGSATVQATPAITLRAPGTNLENFCIRRGGSTIAAVQVKSTGFGSTISNCTLQKVSSYPAILITDSWYTSVYNCTFQSCYQGIQLAAPTASIQNTQIIDCYFQGLATEIDCDIYANISGANLINIIIDRGVMNHALPSGGSQNKYIKLDSTTNTGMWSNYCLGTLTTTVATATTLGGLPYSHIFLGGNDLRMTTS